MRMRQVEERYTPQELREYEASKIAYRDIKNSVDTAKREGIAEGLVKKSLHPALAQDKGFIERVIRRDFTSLKFHSL